MAAHDTLRYAKIPLTHGSGAIPALGTFRGSSRNFDRQPLHQPRKAFDLLRPSQTSRERRASMRENSAIFNARHGAGSFHPHRQPAPTAQGCLKLGNGAIWRTTRQAIWWMLDESSFFHLADTDPIPLPARTSYLRLRRNAQERCFGRDMVNDGSQV